jgi:L-ascorbate metabolism protein UlaG (beta-lactamase superfamily)
MRRSVLWSALLVLLLAGLCAGRLEAFERDTIATSRGNIEVIFIGHGSLLLTWNGKTVYIDPFSGVADYGTLPKADLILITHQHPDHLDQLAIAKIKTLKTVFVLTAKCAETLKEGKILKNGDADEVLGIRIEAVPAYNLVHKRPEGGPFHPKGEGNGYVLTFGTTRIYIAGDTENTPEMKSLKDIDVAFLPMNLPYTMTPEMVADAVRAFRPKVLYPYHFGETDPSILVGLMKGVQGVDVRIRKMK